MYDEGTGAGIPRVSIGVFGAESSDDFVPLSVQTAYSDGSGHYETVLPLDPGEYFISIVVPYVPGYVQKDWDDRTTVVLRAGENLEGIDFPLSKGLSISGTVRDPENKPVSGIRIMAGAERREPQGATSDARGNFEMTGFLPGTQIRIGVWMNEGFADMTVGTWSLPEGGLRNVKVVLVPESTIEGRVVDNNGNPVSGKSVYVGEKRPDGGFTVTGLAHLGSGNLRGSPSDGSYKLTRLAPGTYRVSVPHPKEMEHAKVVEVGRGEHVKGIDLLYHVPGLTISGRVTGPDGSPIARAQVGSWGPWDNSEPLPASALDYGAWAGRTDTNADGRYVLKGRKEGGAYGLQVLAPARRTAGVRQVWIIERRPGVLAGAEDVDFVLMPESTIQGRVIDTQGRSVPNKGVHLDALGPAGEFLETRPRKTGTDAKGTFRIGQLAAGRYRVRVYRPHRREAAMAHAKVVEIGVGEHLTALDLLFDAPGLTISGRVTGPEGRPIGTEGVWCWGPKGDTPSGSRVGTDSDGRYVVEDLEEGKYDLRVEVLGNRDPLSHMQSSRRGVPAGTDAVDLVLETIQEID